MEALSVGDLLVIGLAIAAGVWSGSWFGKRLARRSRRAQSNAQAHYEQMQYVTRSGKVPTDADIEALADEAEAGYDVEKLKARRMVCIDKPRWGLIKAVLDWHCPCRCHRETSEWVSVPADEWKRIEAVLKAADLYIESYSGTSTDVVRYRRDVLNTVVRAYREARPE